ncbi:MFS transporter [Altererythrobacter arenosus]|uniref:MFS transporter n=1 Tax=Altererythrobacter arenosus TaxID=3032592 RepID=A0ABY8FMR6_9SPHN|nr:MFS transporter [Altererythrobacter sp. CAU 1644]WFL76320.1 MFS transporter [Altererythrobacter sp. CAU 1644]
MSNHPSPKAPGSIHAALALLTAAYVLSYIDRTIIALMVGPIRADLGLTDTQFSLLGGLAFAIFYSTLGIPFGWWADRGNRPRIVALGIGLWSLMTMLCGFAKSFTALFLMRVGVGVGEAALSPSAYSLIAETYPADRVGRALGIYGTGIYLGVGLSFALGGVLVERLSALPPLDLGGLGSFAGWQQVFIIVGLPGLLLAPLALLVLREPRLERLRASAASGTQADNGQIRPAIFPWIGRNRVFLITHFLGFSSLSLAFNGYLAWMAEFLLRSFEVGKSTSGFGIGIIVLTLGVGGMLAGGYTADRLRQRGDLKGALTAACGGAIAMTPFTAIAPLMPSATLSLLAFAPIMALSAFCFGPAVIALQLATPLDLRARISALFLLVVNLAGIGLGGTVVAAISDFALGGDGTRLGEALGLAGGVSSLIGVPLLFIARRKMPTYE